MARLTVSKESALTEAGIFALTCEKYLWVRSFSFPGSTPVCGGFFSKTNLGSYLHTFVLGKKTPHTGVDPGKLNERTVWLRRGMFDLCVRTPRYYGCVRLASLGRPRYVAVVFSRTNVGNYLHTFVLEKENATHRGRPGEAKRKHPIGILRYNTRLAQTSGLAFWQRV